MKLRGLVPFGVARFPVDCHAGLGLPAPPQLVVCRDEVVGEKRGGKGYYPEWHSFLQF